MFGTTDGSHLPRRPRTGPACGKLARRRGVSTRWTRRSVRLAAVVAACAAITGLMLVVPPAVAHAGVVQPGVSYVALGDSYSSGEGNPPFEAGTDGNGDFCHRSQAAYPNILAAVFQTAPLTFYACSGATTADMLTDTHYTEPPQIFQPGVSTANLVTLTIGGNNAGFSSVLQACVMQTIKARIQNFLVGPVGRWLGLGADPSCANSSSFTAAVTQQIMNIQGDVENTYQTLLLATDPVHTSIIASDYPHLFPDTQAEQTCIQLSPFLTTTDQTWLNSEGDLLDSTLINAASTVGVNMVDVRGQFSGHAVCGNGGAWINGLSIASGGAGSLIPLVGSFHPNATGHADGYGAAIANYIDNATVLTPEGLPANPPPSGIIIAGPNKSGAAAATLGADTITNLTVSPVGPTFPGCARTLRAGQQVRVVGSGFQPSATVTVYTTSPGQASLEQQVGSVTADGSGAIDTIVTIPVGATGFTSQGTSGNLIGFDAIGIGPDGAAHADSLSMENLASRRSLCGGATPIAGGELHTLAVNADGTVSAWGYNGFGQLGDGTLATSATPVQVNGLSGVSEVTASDLSSYALTSAGTVYAWGDNTFGQLGDGTAVSSTIPVQVSGLSNVEQVAAGNDHVLALNADGTVDAWGLNNAGQLGDGTTVSSATPVAVPGLANVVQVAAGGVPKFAGQSAALKSDGTVWTWGYGKQGQLGLGSDSSTSVPAQVPGLTGIVQIAANGANTYALKSDGTVYAWGDDTYGQIGNAGAGQKQDTPLQANISGVESIAAGGTVALAIKTDGTVWAWGDNNTGQLGDGAVCGKTCTTPVQAIGLTSTGAIAGGYVHSLAETTDGTVWAWGDNSAGELGDGTAIPSAVPEAVAGVTAEH